MIYNVEKIKSESSGCDEAKRHHERSLNDSITGEVNNVLVKGLICNDCVAIV